ncbi:peptide ABC transporter permease [Sulfuracidifex metallicus]|uniref:peptide ABC transporter permease n=1 Tax=Sulfuracidifex metallicus TaxID=47303 RepID=UPI002274E357|nr:peptide ABC transporter permease [Sulfuracidifex metallicus]MCY0849798.1 peptide ABC transporter permease [Sulfuracidifex metallicus]
MNKTLLMGLLITSISLAVSSLFSIVNLPGGKPLSPPTLQYPLGTYINGSNMINQNALALLNTILVALSVGALEVFIGLPYGIVVGALRGKPKHALVRIPDALTIIPRGPLALSLALFFGVPKGFVLATPIIFSILIISFTGWGSLARQIGEIVTPSQYSFPQFSETFIEKFRVSLYKIRKTTTISFLNGMVDGASVYTLMGVLGVGDPRFPTLTTILVTGRLDGILYAWWIFLIPSIFRAIFLIGLYLMVSGAQRND